MTLMRYLWLDARRAAGWLAVVALALGLPATATAKSRGTYFTEKDVAAIRARAALPEFAAEVRALRAAAALLAERSDQEIWELVPAPDLPRALNVRFGFDCPAHGKEVFKVGGQYPWIMSAERPYQVECPVGHERYPSNDFAAYLRAGRKERLDTRQPYVDDGQGWLDAEGHRYFFAAYYNFWWVWRRTIIEGVDACGKIYLATGEPLYAHKAAVCLARLSQIYPRLDFSAQGVSDGKFPAKWQGRINDRIWENQAVVVFARTYDAIFCTLADDRALREFTIAHGVADVAVAIERDILQVQVADIFAQRIRGNKFELGALSTAALVLQNDDPARGATTAQMVDWLLRGGGELEYIFYNGFDRDGMGGESSPAYSAIWNDRFIEAAENLARLGCDVARESKWLQLAKGPSEMRVLGGMGLRIGDTGGGIAGSRLTPNPRLLKFGVNQFRDPDCARWLLDIPAPAPAAASKVTRVMPTTDDRLCARDVPALETLRPLAALATFPRAPFSRALGGFGLAILELDDGAHQHAATLYFGGPSSWHQHYDRLNLGYFVDDREVLSELGYPSHWGPVADYWVKNTPSHYGVLVDEQAQTQRLAGYLTHFADLPGLKLAAADGRAAWTALPPAAEGAPEQRPPPPPVSAYRRTLALLDTGERSTLLIDAFLVRGGAVHDYSFHGLPFARLDCGLKLLREQGRGTLAGPEIAYGADPGAPRKFSGYQFLQQPRWYEPAEVSTLRWTGDGGWNQTTWFPRFAIDEVIVADGVPPLGPRFPASLPYIFLRHRGENLTSLFVAVTEVFRDKATVRAVRRVEASSPAAGGVEIELASGRIWRVYLNEAEAAVTFADGCETSVAFAAVRVDGGKPVATHAVGAGFCAAPASGKIAQAAARLTVREADYRAGKVRVDGPVPTLGPNGLCVSAQSGPNLQAYTIRSERDGWLGFGEVGLIAGRYRGAWDASRQRLVAHERVDGEYNQFNGKGYAGLGVLAEDFSYVGTIVECDRAARTFTLAPTNDAAVKKLADLDGDGRSLFYLTDIPPGAVLHVTPAQIVGGPR
ncbi:MAG: heparinase II/III family protein [Opitutae bacterium]|nr:heparinase II/III family protein [Opitutae bacterium]